MKEFEIATDSEPIECIYNSSGKPTALLIIAHGAGAGMQHSFLEQLSESLSNRNIDVLRFNFPYITKGKKFPSSPKPNIATWRYVVEWALANSTLTLFVSGKSYGGRMASHMLADDPNSKIKGIIYYGFPLHAPGRDSKDRAAHLSQIQIPQLFIQGTKDALAKWSLMNEVVEELPKGRIHEIAGADHSFKIKGQKVDEVTQTLSEASKAWVTNLS